MSISGRLFIGTERVTTVESFRATNRATGEVLEPAFSTAGPLEVHQACERAESAFNRFRDLDASQRARFLEAIATQILALGDALLVRAHAETGLPVARLTGERARTVGQLRMFAGELRRGDWLGLRMDPALPDRQPAPRPDLRQRRIAIGPVAVFGASNFPLAFSVAGGDTAAALAAGCPVVVKGHPAHPGTGELVAQAVIAAAQECNMPEGVFSLLNGAGNAVGGLLAADPRIKAVAFTGSRTGGLALARIAQARKQPIPVFAEMSSVNPVLLLPAALESGAERLAREFVASLTMGVGQFCTNPGLLLAQDGSGLDRFIAAVSAALAEVQPGVMLTTGILGAYRAGVDRLGGYEGVTVIARGAQSASSSDGCGAVFVASASAFIENPLIGEEVFGPASVIVRCADEQQLLAVLAHLEGQLTATLQIGEGDLPLAQRLLPILERSAGRILVNGWPTGVEVSHAMVHGGPFPATTDGCSSSVGSIAIERFLRPVCYQGFPDDLLPAPLRAAALANHPHRLDGVYHAAGGA